MEKTTLQKITDIIINQLGVETEQVTPNANLVDDLGADSLDLVEIAMATEEAFNIEIPEDDAEKAVTVQDLANLVDRILSSK